MSKDPVVPILSSTAVGPLGVCHLPRMWLKILLHATGQLPAGYRHGTGGFDERTAVDLGFDRDAFIEFVETELPTYLEAEDWVRAHAKHLDAATIRKHNELVHRDKPEVMAIAQRAFVGLNDPSIRDATLLNDLDDWLTLHEQLTNGTLPPLQLSSLNAEMTELLKALLDATGATRATIRIDMPSIHFAPSKPAAEAKRTGVPSILDEDKPDAEGAIIGPIAHEGRKAAWIAVETDGSRRWSEKDVLALNAAVERAGQILEEVSRSMTPALSSRA